ncbi:MAG: penicillin-binding protein activator LpoB, partial [Spirochaetaceae bacterium]|nr:penicillin-binding protein activator LpoB [Spirochaetaceae bacterium]
MRKTLFILAAGSLFCLLSCATDTTAVPEAPAVAFGEKPEELDTAIARIAEYFAEKIPPGTKVAVTGIDADRPALSEYIVEAFHLRLQESRRFTMIGRDKRDIVMRELFFQNSGEVSEESRHRIGQVLGPDTMVYGKLYDDTNRLMVHATDVESGVSLVQFLTVILPPEWRGPPSVADRIDRAAVQIGRKLHMQTPVIMGSITVNGTTSSTSLSDFLRPRLAGAMQKRSGIFRVLDESASTS